MPPPPPQGKREHEQSSAQEEGTSPKRRRTHLHYSLQFWDSLSKVPLTRRALKEFDRRCHLENPAPAPAPATDPVRGRTPRLLRSDRRRLEQLASRGGPNLCSLRGYSNTALQADTMTRPSSRNRKRNHASRSSKCTTTSGTKTSTPYSSEFKQALIDLGVFPPFYRPSDSSRPPKPDNIEEIRDALRQPRPSLSPSKFTDSAFEAFQELNEQAASETMAMSQIIPVITGPEDSQYGVAGDVAFTRLRKFDPDLAIAKPDRYYGTKPSQINRRVRDELAEFIVPSTRSDLPVAPNFFLEGKSSSGRADVAQIQATYNGAHGARAMSQLQNYDRSPTYNGSAYTLASTYQPGTGTLHMYATHPCPPTATTAEPQYYITQLDAYAMTGNIDAFRSGATAYRNGRDWAQGQRNRLIENANILVGRNTTSRTSSNHVVSSVGLEEPSDSETSADELALISKRQKAKCLKVRSPVVATGLAIP